MGLGEMVFRTVYEVLGAEKAAQEANSVAAAYETAARRINSSAPALAGPANVVEQSAKQIKRGAGQIKKDTESIKQHVESTGDLAATGFRLTFYALMAITAGQAIFRRIFITGMAQSASAFENAMDRIADASEMTREELGKLKNEILALSTSLGQQASKIASFFAEATVLQFSPEQAQAMSEAFSLAAKATSSDFAKLAIGATRLMALWKQPAEMAPTLAAQIVRLANKTGRSVTEELLPILTNVAPLLPGIAQEQLFALVQIAGRFGEDALKLLPQFARKIYSASKGAIPPNLVSALLQIMADEEGVGFILEALGAGRGMQFLEYLRANIHTFDELVASMKAYKDTVVAMKYLHEDAAGELGKFDAATQQLRGNIATTWEKIGSAVLSPMTAFVHVINNIVTAFASLPTPIQAVTSSIMLFASAILGVGGAAIFLGGTIGILVNRFLIDFNQQIEKSNVDLSSWSNLWKSIKGSFSGGNFEYARRGWHAIVNLIKTPLLFLAPFIALFATLVTLTSDWANDKELNEKFPMLAHALKMAKSALEGFLKPLKESFVLGKSLVGMLNVILTPFKGLLESFGAGFVMGFVTPFTILAGAMSTIAAALDLIVRKIHELGEAVEKIGWLSKFLKGVGAVLGTIGQILAMGPGYILGFMLSVIMLMRVFSSFWRMIAGFWTETRGFIGGKAVPWMRRTGAGMIMGASPGIRRATIAFATNVGVYGFRGGLARALAQAQKTLSQSTQTTFSTLLAATQNALKEGPKTISQTLVHKAKSIWPTLRNIRATKVAQFKRWLTATAFPQYYAGMPEWVKKGGRVTHPFGLPQETFQGMRSSWLAGLYQKPPPMKTVGLPQEASQGMRSSWFAALHRKLPQDLREWMGKKALAHTTIPPEMISKSAGGTGWLAGIMRTLTGKTPPGIVAPGFAPQTTARGFGAVAAAFNRISLLQRIGRLLGRIPWGAPLSVLIDLITGVSLPRALGGGMGMGIGSLLAAPLAGAAAGAIGGPIGSAVGFLIGLAGSIGGYMLGSHIGGLFEGPPAFQPALAPEGPAPLNVQFIANVTVQTSGVTDKQAEEIARKTVDIFYRQMDNLAKEIKERRCIASEIGR